MCETISGDASNTVYKTSYQGPQDNQRERGISNQVGYPCNKLYRNLLQDRIPRDQKLPEQRKSELFARFHSPGLRPEGKTRRTRDKDIGYNDNISGCNKHVPINKTCDNKESGEIFHKKTH